MKIFMYVMVALGATGVLFGTARFFARGQPATMTKEYQEASNEYLKVCTSHEFQCVSCARGACAHDHDIQNRYTDNNSHHRVLTSSPSLVSHLRATLAPAWFRASLRASKCTTPRESWERKKCSRISGRASAAFANKERGVSVVRVFFPCVGCSKDLFEVGKALYLTHASIYLPLYKDLCREECGFILCVEMIWLHMPMLPLRLYHDSKSTSRSHLACICPLAEVDEAWHTLAKAQTIDAAIFSLWIT